MTVSVTVSLSLGIFTTVVVELVSFVAPSHAGQRDAAVFRWLLALLSSLCLCCLPPLAPKDRCLPTPHPQLPWNAN